MKLTSWTAGTDTDWAKLAEPWRSLKAMPICPACHHEQVQLLSWERRQWKCRVCKHWFTYVGETA